MALGEAPKKTPRYYTIATGFLLFVIVVTGILYLYGFMVQAKNNNYREELANIKIDIAERRKDKDVQAYELYEVNKNKLDTLSYLSDIPLFYNSIKALGREYQVGLNNFSYSKGNISVSTIAQSNSSRQAYEKLRRLIGDFRDEDGKGQESIFALEFVKSFIGYNSISSNFDFSIKPEIKQEEENTSDETVPE